MACNHFVDSSAPLPTPPADVISGPNLNRSISVSSAVASAPGLGYAQVASSHHTTQPSK